MFKNNQELIIVFLVVLFLWWALSPKRTDAGEGEGFDAKSVEFVPVDEEKYGIRGDLLRTSNIDRLYIRPDRDIKLSHTGNMEWVSNRSPGAEGTPNCYRTKCPTFTNEYDDSDRCWKCGSDCPTPTKIPHIHSHL